MFTPGGPSQYKPHSVETRRKIGEGVKSASQRKKAIAILGKRVHFAHQVGGTIHMVTGMRNEGDGGGWMVMLDDMAGFFAPHVFVKAGK